MNRIVTLLLFFIGAVILVNCRKKHVPPTVQPPIDTREGRPSASYRWILLTPNLEDPVEYAESAHMRHYFLKESAKYTRSLTLKITKSSSDSVSNPVLRIYGKEGDCLSMTNPISSMGKTTPTRFYIPGSPITQVGYSWSVPLRENAVGTTATLTVTVAGTKPNCTEGILLVDMTSPYLITSLGVYSDSDAMGFVRKSDR